MGIRRSLLALIVAIILVAQGISYVLTRDLLENSAHEREIEKVTTVANVVESLVKEYAVGARLAARALSTSERLVRGISAAPGAHSAGEFAPFLNTVLTENNLDILELTDDTEIVRHSAHDPARQGARASAWGVTEALQGKGTTVAEATASGASVLAIEPLYEGPRVVGTVIAGRRLDERFIGNLGRQVGAELVLVSRGSPLASSSPDAIAALDRSAVVDAMQQKIPIYRNDREKGWTSVYFPMLIVDEGFVMMVRVDGAARIAALKKSSRDALERTALLLFASLTIVVALLRIVLKPLRALRARAQQTALSVTGKAIAAEETDEVRSVVHVLDTLTERLVSHNKELIDARTVAESASASKSEFLSRMSHEIRTPLNGVLGMADLLQRTPLSLDQDRYCRALAASGRQLHGLLSDILDLSKIEAGKIQVEAVDFDLPTLLGDLSSAFSEIASARGNRFVSDLAIPAPGGFRGDPTRLRQVISNLLGNAVKFTNGGTITLEALVCEPRRGDDRSWLRFSVRDTGIGIAPEKVAFLFRPFSQADSSTTRNYGGTGLGLAIAKHLVELMGGSLHLESAPGAGSQFWFEVPLAASEGVAAAGLAHADVPQALTARVLLAEDNAVNQEVIKAMLGQAGAAVTVVGNGELAVAAAREGRFDVVLMDCQMPVMDGYGAASRIREIEPPGRRIPIVALTANAFAEDRERCMEAGMDDYLTKPVDRNRLLQTVARWSNSAGSQGQAVAEPEAPACLSAPLAQEVLDELAGAIGEAETADVIRIYLDHSPEDVLGLKRSAQCGDLKAFGATLHALKSSSKVLGGDRVAELALEGELLARAGDDRAFRRLDAICQAVDGFCRALAAQPCLRDAAPREIA